VRGRESSLAAVQVVRRVVRWYFDRVYGTYEGGAVPPYYVDPRRVGHFAVGPNELREGREEAMFRLFVAMAMFQARRDVVIFEQQRRTSAQAVSRVASLRTVQRCVARSGCRHLADAESLHKGCDVGKASGVVDCGTRPGAPCHIKEATRTFNRMGDLGKLPSSAWLTVWREGGVRRLLHGIVHSERDPTTRAKLLVDRFSQVHRIGRKLATMFVSALSMPALAPGLAPWYPDVNGHELVVIDTNVARAIDSLSSRRLRTYDARAQWLARQARAIDLRDFAEHLPAYSPRLVQQALYGFCSRSNRVAMGLACAEAAAACSECAPALCPFSAGLTRVTV
jgi:hypothetical protein